MENLLVTKLPILLIDSDDAIRRLFGREIARTFFLVSCGTDICAMELIQKQPICLVIMGLRPPFSKSIELLAAIKEMLKPQTVPIIAYSPIAKQEMDLTIPTPYFFHQPIRPAQLVEILNQVISVQENLQ